MESRERLPLAGPSHQVAGRSLHGPPKGLVPALDRLLASAGKWPRGVHGSSACPGCRFELNCCAAEPSRRWHCSGCFPIEPAQDVEEGVYQQFSLRFLADDDLTFHSRMVHFVTSPEDKAHAEYCKTLKSKEETLAWHIKWARWSWLDSLVEVCRVVQDTEKLELMGFITDFPSLRFEGMTVQSSVVQAQDRMAEAAAQFVVEVLRSRSTSMIFYAWSFPGLLAPLLSDKADVVQESMALFRRLVEAWERAKEVVDSYICTIVRKCCLNTPFMKACVHFAKKSDWEMSDDLREICQAVFFSQLNEKLVEDANQKIRDAETRDCPSKVMSHFVQWSVPVASKLIQQYGRAEVEPLTNFSLARDAKHERLFEPMHDKNTPEILDLAGILRDPTWHTLNSVTLKESVAQLHLLLELHTRGDWSLCESVWQNHLMPRGQVVCHMHTKAFFLVLESWKAGCLAWQLQANGPKRFQFDPRPGQLTWLHCFDIKTWMVAPAENRSPLHSRLINDGRRCDICFENNSKPMTLHEWAASEGYKDVPEEVVRMLADRLPSPVPETGPVEECLLSLMRHANPDMSPLMAEAALRKVAASACRCEADLVDFDIDLALDMANSGDHGAIKDAIEDNTNARTQRATKVQQAVAALKRHFEQRPPSTKAKAHDRDILKQKKQPNTKARWLAQASEHEQQHIEMWKPTVARVFVDDKNGRYLLSYPGADRKSFSWTSRGHTSAAVASLKWLWDAHYEATGIACPIPESFFQP